MERNVWQSHCQMVVATFDLDQVVIRDAGLLGDARSDKTARRTTGKTLQEQETEKDSVARKEKPHLHVLDPSFYQSK